MKGKIIILSLLLLVIPSFVYAHPYEDEGKKMHSPVMERIETLRMWQLTKALDLDEETASRLFPILNEYDKKRDKIERQIGDNIRALKKALKEDDASKIMKLTDDIQQKREKLCRINRQEMEEISRVLDFRQQAKYLLFQYNFRRHLRDIIYRARKRHEEGHE